jgi:hypothetical protein
LTIRRKQMLEMKQKYSGSMMPNSVNQVLNSSINNSIESDEMRNHLSSQG